MLPESMHQFMMADPATVWIMQFLAIVVGVVCVGALVWIFFNLLFEWLSR